MSGVDDGGGSRPPVVGAGASEVVGALEAGSIIAVPAVGGYNLAVRVGSPGAEARLVQLAADPEGPHYAVGRREVVRSFTTGWTDELGRLLERCWPGPVEVFVPRAADDADPTDGGSGSGAWAAVVGMPDGRSLRRLCRDQGPWRTVPLSFTEAAEVARGFDAADVAFVIDGGRRDGPPPTLVDATVSPIRVLREGALPASFIEGTMLMGTRRRLFSRTRPSSPG
jgi:L-threonylcarbamoyladenylate synthase